MSVTIIQGKTKTIWLPKAASTQFSVDSFVTWDGSGNITPATDATDAYNIIGVVVQEILASDDDFASTTLIPVDVPVESNIVAEITTTASLVAADLGTYVDLTDASTVDRSDSVKGIVQPIRVLSTTLGHYILNIGGAGVGSAIA